MKRNEKSQYVTSAELEIAVRKHREQTKKLLVEIRNRRADVAKSSLPIGKKSPK